MNRLLSTTVLLCCLALSACGQSRKEPATLQTLLAAGWKTNATEALQAIKAVLKEYPELVFATNKSGWTPLFFAVMGGNTNVVEAMLSSKALVNVRDTNGDMPLHVASGIWGRKEVAALLLANKAEVNARNNKSETPLHMALRYRSAEDVRLMPVAELFKESQSVTNSRGKDGSIIMRNNRDEIIKLLWQHGAHE